MSRLSKAIERFRRQLRPAAKLVVADSPNQRFVNFANDGILTVPRRPLFGRSDRFFTMGSCFAEEIRIALNDRSIQCYPKYSDIKFDSSDISIDELPARDHMNFYNSFTVRMQIEQILGIWTQEDDDYWYVRKSKMAWGSESYQDPYRRLVMARTPELLKSAVESIVLSMRQGFLESSAFIFTFGMTEVFVNRKSGKVVSQKPLYKGGGGSQETELHCSTFAENYDNVIAIIDMVRSAKPQAPIVVTVSPVSLERTFQQSDVVVANSESKSILRAVLGQVSRERSNVYYLPSYEYVGALGYNDAFEMDRRHVKRDVVRQIVDSFFNSTFTQ